MLPRSQRLRASADITRVSQRGSRARSGDLLVTVVPHPSAVPFRAAVVVGKPAGGAVQRNRIRRRIRHGLAGLGDAVPAGSELVVRGGRGVAALTSAELVGELRSAVVRAHRRAVEAGT